MTKQKPSYRAWVPYFDPPPTLSPVEWAEQRRTMPSSHSPSPGPYRVSKTPYLQPILEALAPSHPAKRITVCMGAQLGKSTVIENATGYYIECSPAPLMIVSPSDSDAAEVHSVRLSPMFESIPSLSARIYNDSNIIQKNFITFPGGQLYLKGSGSPSKMRGKSIRYLFLDEVDAYPATVEGDPIQLFGARTTTFGDRAKIYLSSTPTDLETSRIWQSYLQSDQHEPWVCFPCCQTFQRLQFDQLSEKSGKVIYTCPVCGAELEEAVKAQLFPSLTYRPWIEDEDVRRSILGQIRQDCNEDHKPALQSTSCENLIDDSCDYDDDDPRANMEATWEETHSELWINAASPTGGQHVGYKVSGMYAPLGWLSWSTLYNEYTQANKSNDSTKMQAFVNTRLALPWENTSKINEIQHEDLAKFVLPYKQGQVLDNIGFLTAGADVQKDRIEILVVGWGKNSNGFHVLHRIFHGDTSNFRDSAYSRTLDFLTARITKDAMISATCFDSGFNTDAVMRALRPYSNRRIWPILGDNREHTSIFPISGRPSKSRSGGNYYRIGAHQAKLNILNRLSLEPDAPGALHFPDDIPDFAEYFQQLTAEKLEVEHRNGSRRKLFVKNRKRNEIIDLWSYALAAKTALEAQGWDAERMADERQNEPALKPMTPQRVVSRRADPRWGRERNWQDR